MNTKLATLTMELPETCHQCKLTDIDCDGLNCIALGTVEEYGYGTYVGKHKHDRHPDCPLKEVQ